jgi:hypothetical protein
LSAKFPLYNMTLHLGVLNYGLPFILPFNFNTTNLSRRRVPIKNYCLYKIYLVACFIIDTPIKSFSSDNNLYSIRIHKRELISTTIMLHFVFWSAIVRNDIRLDWIVKRRIWYDYRKVLEFGHIIPMNVSIHTLQSVNCNVVRISSFRKEYQNFVILWPIIKLSISKFNCIYMLALGIVACIIWVWTCSVWFGCSNGISVVTRCRSYPIIWFIDHHWNGATCLSYQFA